MRAFICCLFAVAVAAGCGENALVVPQEDTQHTATSGRTAPAEATESLLPAAADPGETGQEHHGRVHGQPLVVNNVTLENGILEFRQGEEFRADKKILVFLFLDEKGILPEEQAFTVEPGSRSFGNPHVHLNWMDEETDRLQSEMFMQDYSLQLEFGSEEERGKLPLSISLKLPGEQESFLKGEFLADVKGFRIIDGQVDTTSDSFETLKYVAGRHLESGHEGQPVEIVNARDGRFTHPDPDENKQQWGWYDIQFRVGEGEAQWQKMIFRKDQQGWVVHETLKPHQLFAAHPVKAPDENTSPFEQVQYSAAAHLEAELAAQADTRPIHGTSISAGYNPRSGYGKATVRYQLQDADEPVERAFLLRIQDEGWSVQTEIDPEAMVDLSTGKIEQE